MKKIIPILLLGLFLGGFLVISDSTIEKETKILFVGDMMFDRTIRKISYAEGFDYLFSCVKDDLKRYDLVVGNLEGPITANPSVSLTSRVGDDTNMTFTFPTETAKNLYQNNIKLVTIGNNHILNFGSSGLEETRKYLDDANVDWFGDPYLENKKTFVRDGIAFISFNPFLGDTVEKTIQEISKRENEGNKTIVFAHWGEEYVGANGFQKNAAHDFIDIGADLVIGAHPHVIQETEKYRDQTIYYSLGNFIFDQWWEESVRTGLGVELSIKGNSFKTKTIKFESNRDGRVCIAD